MFLKQTRGRKEEKGSSQNFSRGSGPFFAAVFKRRRHSSCSCNLELQQHGEPVDVGEVVKDWLDGHQMQKKIN